MRPLHRTLLLLAATTLIAACGGGGSSTTPPPDAAAPDPVADTQFVAAAGSAHSVSLGWTPGATGTYAIERRTGDGPYEQIALLEASAGTYIDDGLASNTTYRYRLVAAQTPLAERSATTTDEQAVVTAPGDALGAAATHTMGAGGGSLTSPDGLVAVDIPAGAFAADAGVELQPVANTAPDGRDAGLRVRLAALPARPVALRLRYGAELDAQADALRIAVQRADGSWLSLPLAQIDKATRTLSSVLPVDAIAPRAARPQSATSRPAAAVALEFHVVKYLAFSLAPKEKTLEVDKTQRFVPHARVRGYEMTIGSGCRIEGDDMQCSFPVPVLETREIAFLNQKPGYARKWSVFLQEGGDATYGTVVADGAVGAIYTAPHEVPDPRTVIVGFESTHTASGRTLVMAAPVTIVEDRWTGTMTAVDGPSIAGTTAYTTAQVSWTRDASGSAGVRRYRPLGTLGVVVTDDNCTTSISPSTQDVSADPQLAALEIDDSVSPPKYKARLITFWTATIHATCPKGSASRQSLVGYGWDVEGTVSADGRTIAGQAMQESARLEWSFSR